VRLLEVDETGGFVRWTAQNLATFDGITVATDASSTGWGFVVGSNWHRGCFDREQLQASINVKEAWTILFAVRWYAPKWSGCW